MNSPVIEVLIWIGTLTFALSGAFAAIKKRFDLVGVLVLAAVTAIGGGSIRDLVTGRTPPPALFNEPLLWSIAATAVVAFFVHDRFRLGRMLYGVDTVSLGLFAALGALRGIEVGFGFWGTVFAGAVSGVGGGIIRDMLSGEIPGVLYRSGDFYASAAAGGAAITFLVNVLLEGRVGLETAVVAGAAATVLIRVGSRLTGLHLPVPRVAQED